jgi:hypothetical protein
VVNSSQGGGGIFAHGWAHHLQIANNRVYNNAGTLSGGISVGQGEFAGPYVQGGATNAPPGSCSDGTGFVTNQHLPDCFQLEVNVHHNFILGYSVGRRRHYLLHWQRLLQVQLQLGVREPQRR